MEIYELWGSAVSVPVYAAVAAGVPGHFGDGVWERVLLVYPLPAPQRRTGAAGLGDTGGQADAVLGVAGGKPWEMGKITDGGARHGGEAYTPDFHTGQYVQAGCAAAFSGGARILDRKSVV